jgi:hypothetical protein
MSGDVPGAQTEGNLVLRLGLGLGSESESGPEPEYNLDGVGVGWIFGVPVGMEDDEWNFSVMTLLMREKMMETEGKGGREGGRTVCCTSDVCLYFQFWKKRPRFPGEDLLSRHDSRNRITWCYSAPAVESHLYLHPSMQ